MEQLTDRLRDTVDRARLQVWRASDLVESLVAHQQQLEVLLGQLREANHVRRRLRLELRTALAEARQYRSEGTVAAEEVQREVDLIDYLLPPLLERCRDDDHARFDALLQDVRWSA